MAFFSRLTQSVWQYVSPVKPAPETRRKHVTTSTTPSSLALLHRRRSMSPTSRVASWQLLSPGTTTTSHRSQTDISTVTGSKRKRTPSAAGDHPVKRGRGRPPKPKVDIKPVTKRPRGRPRKSIEPKANMASSPATRSLAGETMVDDLSSMMSAIHVASSPTQRSFHKGTPASHQSWNTQDALDDTFMENGAAEIIISPASERAASPALTVTGARTQVTQQDLSTFPLIVQPLIVHLIERGHEALLPITWKNDFPFLPPSLFPPTSDQIPMISSLSGSDFRAQKQFTDLLGLGALARDKTLLGKAPESALAKNIEKYILWAIKDAGLMQNGQLRCPELLIAAAAGKDTGVDMLQHILAEKMDHAEGQWRAWLGDGMPLPCFYGLAVSHSMVVIAIYESDGQVVQEKRQRLEKIKDGMQSLGMFDFSDKGLDVWNALAVALLAVHVRDVMRGHAF